MLGTSLVARNLPSNAGDTGVIPGQDLKFHVRMQLSPCATREKSTYHKEDLTQPN